MEKDRRTLVGILAFGWLVTLPLTLLTAYVSGDWLLFVATTAAFVGGWFMLRQEDHDG